MVDILLSAIRNRVDLIDEFPNIITRIDMYYNRYTIDYTIYSRTNSVKLNRQQTIVVNIFTYIELALEIWLLTSSPDNYFVNTLITEIFQNYH